jgi:type II secretory ATPase GspE/PulE/Tfp pilus assembly ATPase PilB-like protein
MLCPYCKEPIGGIDELDRKTFCLDESWTNIPLFAAKAGGCQECRFTGYSGRTAILEIIPITPKVSDMLSKGEMTPYELEVKVAEEGILPNLRRSGLRLLREGKTDLAAVSKVIDMTYTDD